MAATTITELQRLVNKASFLMETRLGKYFDRIKVIGDSNYIRMTATDCTIFRDISVEINTDYDNINIIYVDDNEGKGKIRIHTADLYKLFDFDHFNDLEKCIKANLKPEELTEFEFKFN